MNTIETRDSERLLERTVQQMQADEKEAVTFEYRLPDLVRPFRCKARLQLNEYGSAVVVVYCAVTATEMIRSKRLTLGRVDDSSVHSSIADADDVLGRALDHMQIDRKFAVSFTHYLRNPQKPYRYKARLQWDHSDSVSVVVRCATTGAVMLKSQEASLLEVESSSIFPFVPEDAQD